MLSCRGRTSAILRRALSTVSVLSARTSHAANAVRGCDGLDRKVLRGCGQRKTNLAFFFPFIPQQAGTSGGTVRAAVGRRGLSTTVSVLSDDTGRRAAHAVEGWRNGRMKAVLVNKFGRPPGTSRSERRFYDPVEDDLLTVRTLPIPKIGPNDVLVEMKAVGINPLDNKVPYGYGQREIKRYYPFILGREGSGVIREVGQKVDDLEVGDEVMVMMSANDLGCYSNFVRVEQYCAVPKPRNLSHVEAAALPFASVTAHRALTLAELWPGQARGCPELQPISFFKEQRDKKRSTAIQLERVRRAAKRTEDRPRKGKKDVPALDPSWAYMAGAPKGAKRVLVYGASGDVGSLVVQMLVACGHYVTATGQADSRDRLLSYGVDRFFDHKSVHPFEFIDGHDVIISTVDHQHLAYGECVVPETDRLFVVTDWVRNEPVLTDFVNRGGCVVSTTNDIVNTMRNKGLWAKLKFTFKRIHRALWHRFRDVSVEVMNIRAHKWSLCSVADMVECGLLQPHVSDDSLELKGIHSILTAHELLSERYKLRACSMPERPGAEKESQSEESTVVRDESKPKAKQKEVEPLVPMNGKIVVRMDTEEDDKTRQKDGQVHHGRLMKMLRKNAIKNPRVMTRPSPPPEDRRPRRWSIAGSSEDPVLSSEAMQAIREVRRRSGFSRTGVNFPKRP